MGMPTYIKTLCRRTRLVGRESFAADEGGKRPGNPYRIVGMGMPTYEKLIPDFARHGWVHWQGGKCEAVF